MERGFQLSARYSRWVDWFGRHRVKVTFSSRFSDETPGPALCNFCQGRCEVECARLSKYLKKISRTRGSSLLIPEYRLRFQNSDGEDFPNQPLELAAYQSPLPPMADMEVDLGSPEGVDALHFLTERQRVVVKLRLFPPHLTFEEIGRCFRITKEAAFQCWNRACRQILRDSDNPVNFSPNSRASFFLKKKSLL